jgi:outer membrane protein assembly factor BamB
MRIGAAGVLLFVVQVHSAGAEEWARFRGPGGSGVLESGNLPAEVGADRNVRWKVALPAGHSSPIVHDGRIFLTGFEPENLITLSVRADDGKILWRRDIARPRQARHHRNNNPASPTPVTDGRSVFAFFPDFGLVAWSIDGKELWRQPLGPFQNFQGMANSPVLAGDVLIQVCDQDAGSFLVAVDKTSGRVLRRVERFGPSYCSPVVHERGRSCEIVIAANTELAGYGCGSLERLWWVSGLPWQPKASPIVATVDDEPLAIFPVLSVDNVEEALPPFSRRLSESDADGDGRLSVKEMPLAALFDRDGDGVLVEAEYAEIKRQARAPHSMLAVRLGQRGDLTDKLLWRTSQGIPNVPTPIVYRSTLFVLKEGGILTSLDPKTGEVRKRGRLEGAPGEYYASPVASGGRLYLANLEGKVVVVRATPEWEVESVGSLGEPVFATPAISGDRIYVRTPSSLYCFAKDQGVQKTAPRAR